MSEQDENNGEIKKPIETPKKKKSGCLVWVFVILLFFGLMDIVVDISKYDSSDYEYTAEDLLDAQVNRATGEKISRQDEIMLDGFDEWEADQNKYTNP